VHNKFLHVIPVQAVWNRLSTGAGIFAAESPPRRQPDRRERHDQPHRSRRCEQPRWHAVFFHSEIRSADTSTGIIRRFRRFPTKKFGGMVSAPSLNGTRRSSSLHYSLTAVASLPLRVRR